MLRYDACGPRCLRERLLGASHEVEVAFVRFEPETSHDVHVLHVVRTLISEGGMERAMRRVVEGLNQRGIRHSILLLSDAQDVLDFGDQAPVHRVVSPRRDPRMALGIRKRIEDLRPTVIHVRNWGPWPDTTLARLLRWPQTPLIWSFHGVESLDRLPFSKRLLFRMAGALTDRIFAVSDAARRMLVKLVGIPERRIDVILNGVDVERFQPRGRERAQPKFVVGTVGRLEKIKNQGLLIEACAELAKHGLDLEIRIAGTGSTESQLRAQARALGVEDRVVFSGHVEDVPVFLSELDAFALTSDSEGNPNALLEAMACGLPSVCTAVGAVEEIIRDGESGLLVKAGNMYGLADALARLIGRPALKESLGKGARARIVAHYSLEKMLDAYEALYREPWPESPGTSSRERSSARAGPSGAPPSR